MKILHNALWRLLAIVLAVGAVEAQAAPLAIENRTGQEIINILVSGAGREFYLRLDLLPAGRDAVENPDCTASLRLDTGLEFLRFADVPLAPAAKLVFEAGNCLALAKDGAELARVPATVERLAPGQGDRPVCSLDRFRPAMTMAEVCEILPGAMPRDDNGALLAGLGFAGLTWAARLVPASSGATGDSSGPAGPDSLLEHLALRRPLALADLAQLLAALGKQGYVPWQADFPGFEISLAAESAARSDAEIMRLAEAFIGQSAKAGHGNHAIGEKCAEASVIMAPADRLPELMQADQPQQDVQIYTIYLRPCTATLLLDLAAYRGQ